MERHTRIPPFVRHLLATLLLTIGLIAPAASAQFMGGGSDFIEPRVNSRDVDALVEKVAATEEQDATIRDLFQGYLSQQSKAKDQLIEIFRKAQEAMQQNQDMSAMRDMQIKAIEFYDYQRKLQRSLFEDFHLVLESEQLEGWESFVRYHRRAHILADGQAFVSGSSLDVTALVDDVYEDAPLDADAIGDLLQRYEVDLDRVLLEREELNEKQMKETSELMAEGGNPMENLEEYARMFAAGREIQVRVREVNERYARLISARLSDETRAKFDRQYNKRAVPAVYADSYVDEAFETVMELESFDEEQAEKAAVLRDDYLREADAIRAKWAEALVAWQSEAEMMAVFGGGGGNDATREQKQAKRDLDSRYYQRLRDLLNEDQLSALPDRESADWRSGKTFGD